MHILNSLSHYAAPIFRENFLPSLSPQSKKLLFVASIAFSFLAACYLVSRYCFNKGVAIKAEEGKGSPSRELHNTEEEKENGDTSQLEKNSADETRELTPRELQRTEEEKKGDGSSQLEKKSVKEEQGSTPREFHNGEEEIDVISRLDKTSAEEDNDSILRELQKTEEEKDAHEISELEKKCIDPQVELYISQIVSYIFSEKIDIETYLREDILSLIGEEEAKRLFPLVELELKNSRCDMSMDTTYHSSLVWFSATDQSTLKSLTLQIMIRVCAGKGQRLEEKTTKYGIGSCFGTIEENLKGKDQPLSEDYLQGSSRQGIMIQMAYK